MTHTIAISVPAQLQEHLRGERLLAVQASTSGQALQALTARAPGLRDALFEADGELRKFVRIAVNGRLLRRGQEMNQVLEAGTQLAIIQAITGG